MSCDAVHSDEPTPKVQIPISAGSILSHLFSTVMIVEEKSSVLYLVSPTTNHRLLSIGAERARVKQKT